MITKHNKTNTQSSTCHFAACTGKDKDKGTGGSKPVNSNDLGHIFNKAGHKLDSFLKSFGGNQTKAYNAVQQAGQNYVNATKATGLVQDIVVNVNGHNITIRGMVINGEFKIGTFLYNKCLEGE